MKTKNAIIAIFLIIILGQYMLFHLLLRKFDRLKFAFEEDPVRVYVAGLTENIREVEKLRGEAIWQALWISKRLDKCIELLEAQKGLKPIPIEYPGPKIKGFTEPDPNMAEKYAPPPEPFYEPYESPNNPPLLDVKERCMKTLMCQLDLDQYALTTIVKILGRQIENFEKRLKRLDSDQP